MGYLVRMVVWRRICLIPTCIPHKHLYVRNTNMDARLKSMLYGLAIWLFPALFLVCIPAVFLFTQWHWLNFTIGTEMLITYYTCLLLLSYVAAEIRCREERMWWGLLWCYPCMFLLVICIVLCVVTQIVNFFRPYLGW